MDGKQKKMEKRGNVMKRERDITVKNDFEKEARLLPVWRSDRQLVIV